MLSHLDRRSWLQAAGFGTLLSSVAAWSRAVSGEPAILDDPLPHAHAHQSGTVGRVAEMTVDPARFLRTHNFDHLPPDARRRFYRETTRPDGTLLREYDIYAVDRDIEIAPGVMFPAWTYNGQVPGPTIRATEGDRLRVRFLNQGSHPHSIHFHGWHPPDMDGSLPEQAVMPGESFVYEFDAEPAGCTCITVTPFRSSATSTRGSTARSSSIRAAAGRPPTSS